MSGPAFTPGPWEVREDFIGPRLAPNSSIQVKVARVAGGYEEPEAEANAHLIAAAPELYEALQLFADAGNMSALSTAANKALAVAHDKALAALAKARGEQVPA